MANVFLTDEAYTALKMLKVGNESFSDVVKRLTFIFARKERSIDDFFGCMSDLDTPNLRSAVKKARANRNTRG